METLQTESTAEEHSLTVTDVRFRPNSTQLATSSSDSTVRLWDAADVSYSLLNADLSFSFLAMKIRSAFCYWFSCYWTYH